MPSKRKRDILEGFDPNKSDSEDENFDPTEERPRKPSAKRSRTARPKRSGGSQRGKRTNRYRGSDIEDDEDEMSESEDVSFGEEEHEEEEDDDIPVGATGRRMRKAAVKHMSYKESSVEEEDVVPESDNDDDDLDALPAKPSGQPKRKIVVLKTQAGRLANLERGKPAAAAPTRRATRARTEETEEPLLELSNSGRHAIPSRASRSKSPETAGRSGRATRGAKGVKKPPAPIEEATQETEPKEEDEADQVDGDLQDGQGDQEVQEAADVEVEVENAEEGGDDDMKDALAEEAPEAEVQPAVVDDEDDDDVGPITRRTRAARASMSQVAATQEADDETDVNAGRRRLTRKTRSRKSLQEPSSDFEPGDDEGSDDGAANKAADHNMDESSSPTPRGRRAAGSQLKGRASTRRSQRNQDSGDEEVELDKDELADELEELRESSRSRRPRRRRQRSPSIQYEQPTAKRRRATKPVDYSIKAIDPAAFEIEDDDEPAQTPARRKGGRGGATGGWERGFNTTYGPFGGGGGAGSLLGGPWGTGATGGVDSDSSDDEMVQRSGVGGAVGMTPTSAAPPIGLFGVPGAAAAADAGGIGGATPNVGKVKNQKALADADPLGVDLNVDFSKVGGLQGHIDQLKEMVQLPLLYPELFQRFHVTPPRGVLFHGPPGTGKTLLARALANSVGTGGRKITFYMRKGADALSKWVGEAEKQLRLLFEEARRTQPSIIFFDEIDGLAPVRSSKQEQIHASIVSTLLALMDGMDGRGQVIVIGATNRPDNIDPALRRPGRFDREFYFPLPDKEGRRSIIDIHTKDWGMSEQFRDLLAERTKGYGGADLRALCTEAALNAIQRTYPQIYSSKEKLIVNPDKINIHATDFMLSIKKLVPSSERQAASAAAPLPKAVEPLLRSQYKSVLKALNDILPRKKNLTALEEAMYEQPEDADHGFGREQMSTEFERSRIFRPRLLITGKPGMGQTYLASAILNHLEGVHVQNFDLATLLGDGRPLEQVIVSQFIEVKRHKPSVIYIPAIDGWWEAMSGAAITTFKTMLRTIPPTDPILLLGTSETEVLDLDSALLRDLFGFSKKNRAMIERPNKDVRIEYFSNVIAHARKSPHEFPDPADRKKRVLEDLPVAPPPPPKVLTKAETKAQRKADLHSLNILKTRLQPIMDQIHRKYRKFRQPVIPINQIAYLFDESDPNYVRPDLAEGEKRPYEIARDKEGTEGIRDTVTGKFFYNLETTTIEERLANGYYCRPRDFYADINRLYNDAKNIGDRERALKANELRTNVEVDVTDIELQLTNMGIRFEEIYERQLKRAREEAERAAKKKAMQDVVDLVQTDITQENDSDSQGPVGIGFPISGASTTRARFQVMSPRSNGHGAGSSSHLTNGNSVPSRHNGDDTEMGGMEEETQPNSGHTDFMRPPWPPAGGPRVLGESTRATAGTTQISQVSAMTSIPPGMSPSAIINDASTTKTSDPSTGNRGSDLSTQRTNGLQNSNPDEQSQMPDTQQQFASQGPSQSTSDSQWPHSQAHGVLRGVINPPIEQHSPASSQARPGNKPAAAAAANAAIGNILNSDENHSSGNSSVRNSGVSTNSSQHQQTVVDEAGLARFLDMIAEKTSGCTIEQLEQINRELMDEIWKTRHEWNRTKVLSDLRAAFNETIADIEVLQGLESSSQDQPPPDPRTDDTYVVLR
ncbi:AAA-domain-containing protein [Coniochaeta sp. PMI_546]|nr:AAA-domain-containing protein [Coniochaeta sp. PMI_546]